VLDKWGLGYDELRAIKPDIIYAQQSGMGGHGTYGRFRSVGPVAAAFAGTSEMSGLPEPFLPAGWGYSYLDWLGAYSFGLAMVSALYHRDRTGQGQWIDASQCEAGIFASGTSVLDWSANGREWRRYGNRSPYKAAAPHGVFPCEGTDAWIAIACFDEEQWRSLCRVAGRPEWQDDTRFRTLSDRLSHQDELERAVAVWTIGRERYDLMAQLQQSGVPAGVCQTAGDRCDRDPQLEHLDWLTEVTGTKIGTWPIAEVPVKMSANSATVAGTIGRGAPCYGEDNDFIYGELLGMSKGEIADLAADDVI
jgi:crotonobetainyl-CoA:carnitine CoA-transferase CaiB-like acyl-CoA transferase